jgi:hypothetical protein
MRGEASLILPIVGALLLLGAAVQTIGRPVRYLLFGEATTGIVVDVVWGRRSGAPIVEYATRTGEVRRYASNAGDSSPYEIGTRVAIRYFEADAKAAIISSSFLDMWFGTTAMTVPGLIFIGIAVAQRQAAALRPPEAPRQTTAKRRKARKGRRL